MSHLLNVLFKVTDLSSPCSLEMYEWIQAKHKFSIETRYVSKALKVVKQLLNFLYMSTLCWNYLGWKKSNNMLWGIEYLFIMKLIGESHKACGHTSRSHSIPFQTKFKKYIFKCLYRTKILVIVMETLCYSYILRHTPSSVTLLVSTCVVRLPEASYFSR